MMSHSEFSKSLSKLKLSEQEASRFLSVSSRTVRRWATGAIPIPGPVEQAIRAWIRLDELNLAWQPDGIPLWDEHWKSHVERVREHGKELKAVLEKVENRKGPSAPWTVSLSDRKASLGPIELTFNALANGSFSPSMYRRTDQAPDLQRDLPLLEDAFYCIAMAIGKAGKQWHEA